MYILKKSPRTLGLDEPIKHGSHKTPVTRRDFIAQGFRTGPAIVAGGAILSALMGRTARGAMSPPLEDYAADICNISAGAGKVPFIAFDLAGGANLHGSEMLIGANGNPLNFLSTQGYATVGLPGNMTPGSANAASPTNNFINTEFGAPWHSDGAILRGMLASTQAATRANVNGFGIAARSENDTGNNPHNPMYGINRVGADGQLLTLIGSQNTDSGGNSMAPAGMMNPAARPTKVDRASDVTGLVDTGELSSMFSNSDDAIAVLESMTRLGHARPISPTRSSRAPADEAALRELVKCGYVKSTYLADRFRSPAALNPDLDADIVGADRHLHAGRVRRGQRVPQDRRRHEDGHQRLRRCGHGHDGWLRLPRPGPQHRRNAQLPRGPLHRRLPRIRAPHEQAADDLHLQRRFAVGERRGQQHRRRSRQARLGERQPVHGCVARAGASSGRPGGIPQ